MSGALRTAVPRVCRAFTRAGPSQLSSRHYHRHRLVPIRSLFDEVFSHRHTPWPFRMMEDHMRSMEKLVDSVAPRSRFWDPESFINHRAGRDVQVKYNAKEFEVKLEIEGYKPEDLNVQIVGDELSINGRMKDTDQHGTVSSEFTRSFTIPENVDVETMESMFTNEGHLLVRAKVKGAENVAERTINITREAPPSEAKEEKKE